MLKISLLVFGLLGSCEGNCSPEAAESDLNGIGGKATFSTLLDHTRTMADDIFLAKNIGRELTMKIGRGEAVKAVPRDVLKKELVQMTLKNKGIPPDHLHRVMRLLVDDDSTLS